MKLILIALLLATASLAGAANAADAPIVREIYRCNFNDGQDMDDLMAARDFYLRQMEKAGQEPAEAFVWIPYKVDAGVDVIWANNHADMVEFGDRADAFYGSAEGQAALDRFNSVMSCTSSLGIRRQFFSAGGEFSAGPPAVIGAAACDYREGRGPEDLDDLLGHLARTMETLAIEDGFMAFATEPATGSPRNSADLYLYGVQGTTGDWARRNMALQASPEAGSLFRHLDVIVACRSSLWWGQRVVPPQ